MKTIYLDHNIIQYFSGRFPDGVDPAPELEALATANSDPDCHFVLSPWSIYEAASGNDLNRIEASANFIEGLRLLFIPDHPVLARREIRRYVFRKYFGVSSPLESPFATCYSQHLADLGVTNVTVGNHTAARMIRHYARTPVNQLDPIDQQKEARPEILRQLQDARAEGVMSADFERQITVKMMSMYCPERNPDGCLILAADRGKIIDDLAANYGDVLRECPTLWCDSLLSDFRIENPNRNPRQGDAIDLMHACSALVYCDSFVSHDRYTRSGAERAVKVAGTRCKVVPLLSSVFLIED